MKRLTQRWFVFLVVMASLSFGCDWQGIHLPRDDGPTTAQYRFESEVIANATLVREDTMPEWQLGRHAFKRGPDRLLVISRITSFADKHSNSLTSNGAAPRRYDKILERVWIVLPLGTQVGQTLRIDKLEYDFLTGYDEGYIDGQMYIQPVRLLGKLTILEEHPDSITIDIDMVVEPRKLPRWHYKRVETIPITTTGVRARPAQMTLAERRRAAETAAQQDNAPPADTQGDTDPPRPDDQAPATGSGAAATQPADAAEQPFDVKEYITGKWVGVSPNNAYELRFQFNPTGEFIYSTCRSHAPPMIKSGRYRVKQGHVILDVDFLGSGSFKDRSHMRFLKPLEMFRVFPINNTQVVLRMTGEDMFFREPGVNEVRLSRGEFQDMFLVPPPSRK